MPPCHILNNTGIESQSSLGSPRATLKSAYAMGIRSTSTLNSAMTIQRIVLVDNWGSQFGGTGRGSPAHIERLIQDIRPDAYIHTEIATGNSSEVLPSLTGEFDLILVDGDHSESGAAADLSLCVEIARGRRLAGL
jgi:hypothetical protein